MTGWVTGRVRELPSGFTAFEFPEGGLLLTDGDEILVEYTRTPDAAAIRARVVPQGALRA